MTGMERVVDWFFSVPSFLLHTVWFAGWFLLRGDINLLTNIVSLEAIYLSLAIGLAQKGHHERTRKHVSESLEDTDAQPR